MLVAYLPNTSPSSSGTTFAMARKLEKCDAVGADDGFAVLHRLSPGGAITPMMRRWYSVSVM